VSTARATRNAQKDHTAIASYSFGFMEEKPTPAATRGDGQDAIRRGGTSGEVMTMRFALHGAVAVVALLIGVGGGYLYWGTRATDLTRQVQAARSECDQRVADAERRAQAAEERARLEIQARKVFEDQLHQLSPQK
jgi:uncharacterized protein HemX